MIRIVRPEQAPVVLAKGKTLVEAMHARVAADAAAGTAADPFTFDRKIYGHETVKDSLLDAQHQKCAYCEGHFLAFGWGDVEHYRPKGYSQQQAGGAQNRPGYYWLAYEWTNLLGSCSKCNQLRKKNLFPLRVPGNRARAPEDVAAEEPLILDPAGDEDPREHVGFEKNVPRGLTDVGQQTIDSVALDREELNGLRLHHLKRVFRLKQIVDISAGKADEELQVLAEEATAELEELKQPHAPFSSMTLCLLGF